MYQEPGPRHVVRAFGRGPEIHRECILKRGRCELKVEEVGEMGAHTIDILLEDDDEWTKERVFESLK